MDKRPIDPNAFKALEEMKIELAGELGITDTSENKDALDPTTTIFTAGSVDGLMTQELAKMGEEEFIDED